MRVLCDLLHLNCLEIYTPYLERCPWVANLRQQFPQVSWKLLSKASLASSSLHSHTDWCCFVDGSCLPLIPTVWFIAQRVMSLGHQTHTLLPFRQVVHHFETGGVIDGSWCFNSNQAFQVDSNQTYHEKDESSSPPRTLRHIVNQATPVHSRQTILPPRWVHGSPHIEESCIPEQHPGSSYTSQGNTRGEWDSALSMDNLWEPKPCWSAFSPTGWVRRSLTLSEMMLVFDVPMWAKPGKVLDMDDMHLPIISEVIETSTTSPPFMRYPPLKVLQRACENWSASIKLFQYDRGTTPGVRREPWKRELDMTPILSEVRGYNRTTHVCALSCMGRCRTFNTVLHTRPHNGAPQFRKLILQHR